MFKKVVLILAVLLFLTQSAFSATRKEMQTALDLIRFTNVAHDLLNRSARLARGEIKKRTGGLGDVAVERDYTVSELKVGLNRQMDNVKGYYDTISIFLGQPNKRVTAINGLTALGVDINGIEADLAAMDAKISSVKVAVSAATNATDLKAIGDDIDNDIPPLELLRHR